MISDQFMQQADHFNDEGTVIIPLGDLHFVGNFVPPMSKQGAVIFAHGSGSSRLSPRNNYVAAALRRRGLGTLLFDLLTEEEGADRSLVFNIPLLASRLALTTAWLAKQHTGASCRIGYFGASTGAAAALMASVMSEVAISAIVSRGGRPDLAWDSLPRVTAPTLLLVGGEDKDVLSLNRRALERLRCEKQLSIIEGATHLFEEPGTLDDVIDKAEAWFLRFLSQPPTGREVGTA